MSFSDPGACRGFFSAGGSPDFRCEARCLRRVLELSESPEMMLICLGGGRGAQGQRGRVESYVMGHARWLSG